MYCPLHSHTYASNLRFLDCINRPKEMVEKAISLGFSGIAFTDHEALSAAITILKVRDEISKDHPDFKIIFGNEIYLIDESSLKNTNDYFHFILLAKDLTGWNQIKALSSRAWERGYTEKGILRVPTTYQDLEEIVKSDPGHVFGATACLGGQLPKQILSKDVDGANRFVKWCIDVFGKDNFALELQPSDSEEQITVNKVLIKFGKAYGVQNIVTTDMHYLNKEDFAIHSAFLNSRSSSDRETEKFYKYTYMMTIDEMVELLSKSDLTVEESLAIIDNTGKIADQVENYDFRHSTIVPKIKIPEFSLSKALYHKGYKAIDSFYDSEDEQDRYLMHKIEEGIVDKQVVIDNEKLDRINTELDVLQFLSERLNQRLSAYLNLTVNIIDIAWQASLVAPGRGCFAPGSPVMLANGETKPIEEVQIGDMVITHTGNMRKVYNVLNYDVNEELYSVKTIGRRELTCTNNHKIYAVKQCLNRTEEIKLCPVWIEAQDLSVGDYITIPKSGFVDKNTAFKEDPNYFYAPIYEVTKAPYIGKVYDLSVEEDTSYNINGLAVHNSSTGFYINYLIGIVQVDPLKYGLCYWRFLNKERVELPDVDSDFQPEKTADIIQLLRDEYGEDNVLNCATFKTESLKSAILSVGRGLGFNNDDMQALAALVPSHRGQTYTLKECLEGDEEKGFDPVADFASKLNAFPGLLKGVEKIEGLPTNTSIHASALYVFNNGYLAQNSLMRAPNKTKITAFSMLDCDSMGALKIDVLRTDAQSKIAKCIELLLKDKKIEWKGSLRDTYDSILHPDVLSYDNPQMWESMSSGQIPNLFQFDTNVGGVCIKKAKPTNVMELAEINSIMRLQADGEQPIDRYVRFNKNPEMWDLEMAEEGLNEKEISIMHKYLDGSHGVSGSQEVLMKILMDPDVCNFTLGEANMARKAIAKKQAAKLIQLKKDFYEKGKLTPDN